MKLKLITVLMLLMTIPVIKAQEALPAAGGTITGSGGSVSFTVGQVGYTTITGSGGTVTQGVQQPYEIMVITGIEKAKDIMLELSVYPNPTNEFIKLKVENYEIEGLSYQLCDINGKIIQDKKVEGTITTIYLENLIPAAYFLIVTDNEKEIKTFKIIKN